MRRLAAALLVASALAGCARDPVQVAWDDALYAALRDPPEARVATLDELARVAPRVIDRGTARVEAARALEEVASRRGEPPLEAARRWLALSRTAERRADRARGHYQLGRLAEARGLVATADAIDRTIVITYPDLMPGERSLAHLVRRARARGDAAMDALLAWLRVHPAISAGALFDNALFLAAEEALLRYRRDGDPRMRDVAELLLRRVEREHPTSALWNDAVWARSYLLHESRRFEEEIVVLRTILRTRASVSLFGQNEHEHYWKGQLRIARVQWKDLGLPADAVGSYLDYLDMFPLTSKRDDLLFFAGCAAIDAGLATADDNPHWQRLAEDHPESKFVRRLPRPSAAQCSPPEVE
ncbi:MAG: hypothetical protein IT385_02280 [Deltaproteobacteria bacterium]|nr:hypothetical protein [Deltaproteobacteria bacterium]